MKCMKCEQLKQHCMMFGCINPNTLTADETQERADNWKVWTN